MVTKVVGKLESWADADSSGSDFLNLEEGSNKVRIVTSPYQFYIHWTEDQTGAKRKVRCATDQCPLCQQNDRAKPRWVVGAISRKTNKPVVIEIGPQVKDQLVLLSRNAKWGDPRKFDVDILRGPKGSQPLYSVMPEPKEPITDEEKVMIKDFMARVDFVKISAASTPDEVRERLGLASEAPKSKASSVSNDFEDTNASEPEASEPADDDFNFDA